jgi:ERF superfamily
VKKEANVDHVEQSHTKPIDAQEIRCGRGELETLLVASLKDSEDPHPRNDALKRGPGRYREKKGGKRGKQKSAENGSDRTEPLLEGSAENGQSALDARPNGDAAKLAMPVQLNLRQKLAEVRRRIGYVQKRGFNERNNYSYVTAADLAGSVGDILAELGVVIVPRLESIVYESARGSGAEAARAAQVVMAYTFADVDTGEEITAKVAGQGLDAGDKAPYKAMTGALKYALLQSFLLATGDDPEEERLNHAAASGNGSDRLVTAEEAHQLRALIDETETELERVLAYYKVASVEEMRETSYRRAIDLLNRKRAKQHHQNGAHAQD